MNESKTAEQVFKPGNLAWGGDFFDNQSLRAFLQEGIKTGTAAVKLYSFISNSSLFPRL